MSNSLELTLLFLIHELVHHNTMFSAVYKSLSEEDQEAVAYFVANKVLRDILNEKAEKIIKEFTVSWPHDFPKIAEKYSEKIDLERKNIIEYIKENIFGEAKYEKL